jgi:hypothetical protein
MVDLSSGSGHRNMSAALTGTPRDVADVVDQLVGIQRALDNLPVVRGENPIAEFNNLYLTIVMQVLRCDREGRFADRAFLNLLHVEFARSYVTVLRGWAEMSPMIPEAWAVLFRDPAERDMPSLPYAAAGANAHLNYDLPLALAACWERLGPMSTDSVQYQDYQRLNEIVFNSMRLLCAAYQAVWYQYSDRIPVRFDESHRWLLLQLTRDTAWDRARQFWRLCDDPLGLERMRADLDEVTARTGRALLNPFEARLA